MALTYTRWEMEQLRWMAVGSMADVTGRQVIMQSKRVQKSADEDRWVAKCCAGREVAAMGGGAVCGTGLC